MNMVMVTHTLNCVGNVYCFHEFNNVKYRDDSLASNTIAKCLSYTN